jgi:membrane protease YdiL (CAAX protease family)
MTDKTFRVGRSIAGWVIAVFGLTGLAVIWLTLAGVNPDTGFSPAIILIAYSPTLAAILVAWLLPGAGGLRALFRQMAVWRVHIGWYALALLGPWILVLAAIWLYALFGGAAPVQWLAIPASGDIGGMIGPLIAGSLGEELGWRGFAQRLLQKRYSLLWASVAVGLLWATWHSWPMLAPGGAAHANTLDIMQTYVRLAATAVIYGWIYARTGGSVLLVMLAHAGHNIAIDAVPASLLDTTAVPLLIAGLYAVVAIVLVVGRPSQFLRRA